MVSYVLFPVFLWITVQFTQQAMEFQKEVLGWLDDATFFPVNEQQVDANSVFCFDGLTFPEDGKAKLHGVDDFDIEYVSEILEGDNWMDSKIDLSILDSAFQDYLAPAISTNEKEEALDVGSEIDSLVDTYFQQNAISSFPTSFVDVSPASVGDIHDSASASETFCIPEATASSQVSVLPEVGLQLPNSPLDSSWSATSSPATVPSASSSPARVPSASDGNLSDVSESSSSSEQEIVPLNYVEVTIDDIQSKCNGPEKKSPKLKAQQKAKVQPFSPYHLKKESRKERKKVQNKEAAARYRTKKREQDKVLGEEVEVLENEQKGLQEKHDQLKNEIKYLKSLMKEMFKARGLLK